MLLVAASGQLVVKRETVANVCLRITLSTSTATARERVAALLSFSRERSTVAA